MSAPGEARTHGLQIMRLTRCLLRYGGFILGLAGHCALSKFGEGTKILLRRPGIEPGSTAWKAAMLTTIPPTLLKVHGISSGYNQNYGRDWYGASIVLIPEQRLRGAMVARLTPDQKAACSSHVGVSFLM